MIRRLPQCTLQRLDAGAEAVDLIGAFFRGFRPHNFERISQRTDVIVHVLSQRGVSCGVGSVECFGDEWACHFPSPSAASAARIFSRSRRSALYPIVPGSHLLSSAHVDELRRLWFHAAAHMRSTVESSGTIALGRRLFHAVIAVRSVGASGPIVRHSSQHMMHTPGLLRSRCRETDPQNGHGFNSGWGRSSSVMEASLSNSRRAGPGLGLSATVRLHEACVFDTGRRSLQSRVCCLLGRPHGGYGVGIPK